MIQSYATRATRYAEAVVAGLIDASKLTIAACQRHLDDLARSAEEDPDFPFVFDEAAANRACGFVEMFPHVKGAWARARELIVLEDWQCFVIASPFGWVDRNSGHRRFRTVYIEVPRKNAKTTLSAQIALYMMTADGEQGAEIVAAATSRATRRPAIREPPGLARDLRRGPGGRRADAARPGLAGLPGRGLLAGHGRPHPLLPPLGRAAADGGGALGGRGRIGAAARSGA